MTTALELSFWQTETALMWDAMQAPAMDALLLGAANGADQLPLALQGFVNWDLVNQNALQFLNEYRFALDGITEVTRRQVQEAIANWIRAGDPLPRLIEQLTPIFGATRAESIAVTEVTRIFARGNLMSWQSTGFISGKRWMTARDERVCPLCGPLHGQIVELDNSFTLDQQQIAESPQMKALMGARWNLEGALRKASSLVSGFSRFQSQYPPAHVRCRCWLQPFVSEVAFEKQIGDILAGQFFARAHVERYTVGGVRGFVVVNYG